MKLLLILVIASLGLLAGLSFADHYRTGSLEALMATPNWELVREDCSVTDGRDCLRPVLIRRYATAGECDAHQAGRLSLPRAIGGKRYVAQYTCRHPGDEVI